MRAIIMTIVTPHAILLTSLWLNAGKIFGSIHFRTIYITRAAQTITKSLTVQLRYLPYLIKIVSGIVSQPLIFSYIATTMKNAASTANIEPISVKSASISE